VEAYHTVTNHHGQLPRNFPVEAAAEATLASAPSNSARHIHGQRLFDREIGELRVAEEVPADAGQHLATKLKNENVDWSGQVFTTCDRQIVEGLFQP